MSESIHGYLHMFFLLGCWSPITSRCTVRMDWKQRQRCWGQNWIWIWGCPNAHRVSHRVFWRDGLITKSWPSAVSWNKAGKTDDTMCKTRYTPGSSTFEQQFSSFIAPSLPSGKCDCDVIDMSIWPWDAYFFLFHFAQVRKMLKFSTCQPPEVSNENSKHEFHTNSPQKHWRFAGKPQKWSLSSHETIEVLGALKELGARAPAGEAMSIGGACGAPKMSTLLIGV